MFRDKEQNSAASSFSLIDPVSESMLVFDDERFPRSEAIMFMMEGVMDPDAFRSAYEGVLKDQPFAGARLQERRRRGRYFVGWVPVAEEDPPLEFVDLRHRNIASDQEIQVVMEWLGDWPNHFTNPFAEPCLRTAVLGFTETRHCIVGKFHHLIADGGTLFEFWKQVFAAYHKKRTGVDAPWGHKAALSTDQPRRNLRPSFPGRLFNLIIVALGVLVLSFRKVHTLGDEDALRSVERVFIRRCVEGKDLERLLRRASAMQVTMSDFFTAATMLALDRFGKKSGRPAGLINIGLLVNLRGFRKNRVAVAIDTTSITIRSTPAERRRASHLLSLVMGRRKRRMAAGLGMLNLFLLRRLMSFARRFPFATRKKILRRLMAVPYTLTLSNVGVLWPEKEEGRTTGETFLKDAGGLSLRDYYVTYSLLTHCGCAMVVSTFNRKLSIIFSAFCDYLSPENQEEIMDLFMDALWEVADISRPGP